MNVAIITLSPRANYGGILQAYALQTVLQRKGHNVRIIAKNYKYGITPRLMFISIPRRILLTIFGNKQDCFKEFRHNREEVITTKNTSRFIRKWLNIDERHPSEIHYDDYDAYIVGSDQIWRPEYIVGGALTSFDDALLGFTKGWKVKRMSYAASFGIDEWNYSDKITQVFKGLLPNFDNISVREEAGVQMCQKIFGLTAELMPDPTLLLEKEEYIKLIENFPSSEGQLFAYFLDDNEEKQELVNRIAKERKLKPFYVSSQIDHIEKPLNERIHPPLEKWLRGFFDAEFVVTDSFHGCVFSIIFGKPFMVVANKERGLSRFTTLLKRLDLLDNLFFLGESTLDMHKPFEISIETSEKINKLQKLAHSFLDRGLK